MKNIILLAFIIPALSACGLIGATVGTATKVVKTAVDIVVENDTEQTTEDDIQLGFSE